MDFNNNWLNNFVYDIEEEEDNSIIDNGEGESIIFPILYTEFFS